MEQERATERQALLEKIMAGLADDPAYFAGLHHHFGADIRWSLIGLARRLGLPMPDAGELDGLVLDACTELIDVARWWRPDGGALPWVYGRDRLAALLRRHAGPRTVPLLDADALADDVTNGIDAAAPAPAPDDPPAVVVLDRLVRHGQHPVLRLLREGLDRTCRPDNHEVVLLYAEQLSSRDPAPAHTVGSLVGRSPTAVRQVFCRARKRLRALAVADPEFRALLALPFLVDEQANGAAA